MKSCHPNALPALARSLPALTRLEGLLLHSISELAPLPASAEYSALLPLSLHITSIDMTWWDHDNLLHDGCGQRFLAAGRQLPQLKRLMLGLEDNWDVWDDNVRLGALANCTSGVGTCLGEGSLSKLVSCCPGLQQLGIPGLVEPGVQMQPLLQLTALTWLSVGGEMVTDDVACDVLAQLSGLRQLGVFDASGFTDCGLLALTQLRQLAWLAVGGCGISAEVSARFAHGGEIQEDDEGESLELRLQVRCFILQVCSFVPHYVCKTQLLVHVLGVQTCWLDAHRVSLAMHVEHLARRTLLQACNRHMQTVRCC